MDAQQFAGQEASVEGNMTKTGTQSRERSFFLMPHGQYTLNCCMEVPNCTLSTPQILPLPHFPGGSCFPKGNNNALEKMPIEEGIDRAMDYLDKVQTGL